MKLKRNIFTFIIVVLFIVVCCKSQIVKKVKGETLNPELSFVSYNISYSEYIYLMVAVGTNNIDNSVNSVKLLFWDSEQSEYTIDTAKYISSANGNATVSGQKCLIFYSNGIAAKKMADNIYMRAYVEVDGNDYYSDVTTYSVVQYVSDRINSGKSTEEQLNLYNALLEYGAAAQVLFDYNTNNLANKIIKSKSVKRAVNLTTNLSIVSYNISYSEYIYLMVAVGTNNIDNSVNPVKLLFWDSEQSEYTIDNANYSSLANGNATVSGQKCLIFYSNGIAAKKMSDNIYMRAYVEVDGEIIYSDVVQYSVPNYVEDRITNANCSEKQLDLYKALLDYGTAAQILFDYNTDNLANEDFAMISIKNGTLPNETSKYMYLIGQTVTVIANKLDGKEFLYWEDDNNNIVSYNETFEFVVSEDSMFEAVYTNVIDININTVSLNITKNIDLSWCDIVAENSSDLVYINITITINNEEYVGSLYKLIVNGIVISESKLQISNNTIVYVMEDPNWSDFV